MGIAHRLFILVKPLLHGQVLIPRVVVLLGLFANKSAIIDDLESKDGHNRNQDDFQKEHQVFRAFHFLCVMTFKC